MRVQASLLERAEHRSCYRLVGLGHELEHWPGAHEELPPLPEAWERAYDPAELHEDEAWVVPVFEPVRRSFFNGPMPPPMQFMLPARALPKGAEVATLVGLHPKLHGVYKLVVVFRRLKCVHVYECCSHARQWWFALHLSTDARFTLREMQPSTAPRRAPYPEWWQHGDGSGYPVGLAMHIVGDVTSGKTESVLIKRDASDPRNLSGGVECFVPERLLLGALPQALLDEYLFWQDEATEPHTLAHGSGKFGYRRLRG